MNYLNHFISFDMIEIIRFMSGSRGLILDYLILFVYGLFVII